MEPQCGFTGPCFYLLPLTHSAPVQQDGTYLVLVHKHSHCGFLSISLCFSLVPIPKILKNVRAYGLEIEAKLNLSLTLSLPCPMCAPGVSH